jgi:hypothetical protein
MKNMNKKKINARIKELKSDLNELKIAWENELEWVDGEKLLDNEYYTYSSDIEDEINQLKELLEGQ